MIVPSHARAGTVLAPVLALAVGLAFADTSIVMLGLPEMYAELGGSVFGISLVATAYNVVVAIGAFAMLPLTRHLRPALLAAVGLVVFAGTSLAAGMAESLAPLLVWRGAQGLGAALVLAASLPLLVAVTGSPARGRTWWSWAGITGAALGPALGGLLTEAFDWRAIFLAQAPIALLALGAAVAPPAWRVEAEPSRAPLARGAAIANLGLVCAFGGLAGALFLGVLLVVTVWGMGPLAGAIVVSALPIAALAVRPIGSALSRTVAASTGAVLLALGLVGLAGLQGSEPVLAVAALAVCGAGFGLLVPPLTGTSLGSSVAGSVAAVSVGARHVGLVLALLAVAPILATDLERGGEVAARESAAVVLDADLPIDAKLDLAGDLSGVLDSTPNGEVPDLDGAVAAAGSDGSGVATVQADLMAAIESSLTSAFSRAFLLSAALALLTLVPIAVGAARSRRERAPQARTSGGAIASAPALGAGVVVGLSALVVAWVAMTGPAHTSLAGHDPCVAREGQPEPEGIDATIQRVALDGLDGAACELGTTREELVLAFAPEAPGAPTIPGDDETIERATRAGLVRAVDAAEDRGELDSRTAVALRVAGRNAPIDEGLSAYRRGSELVASAERGLDRLQGASDSDLVALAQEGLESAADAGLGELLP